MSNTLKCDTISKTLFHRSLENIEFIYDWMTLHFSNSKTWKRSTTGNDGGSEGEDEEDHQREDAEK